MKTNVCLECEKRSSEHAKKAVTRFLFEYGFPTKLHGYRYLKECLLLIANEIGVPSNKMLFIELAERFKTDSDNIERCLQTLVHKMWKVLASGGLFSSRPTIREFVMRCSEFVAICNVQPRSAYEILLVPDKHFM